VEEAWDRARRCEFEAGALRLAQVPRRLERICLKAMAADPADRYATAEEFKRALESFLVRPRRIGVAAAILLATTILSAFYLRPPAPQRAPSHQGTNTTVVPPGPIPTPTPSPTRAASLHGEITLWVNEPKSTFRRGLRLNQPGAVPVKTGDEVRVEAWVDRPAYLYLFWLGSDGKVAPLYPWKEHQWTERPLQEGKVERVELPEVVDDTMTLPPSAPGLETLVLLAREDSPLPRDAGTALEKDLAGPPPTSLPDWMNQAVWL
jgi:hypothetical protein